MTQQPQQRERWTDLEERRRIEATEAIAAMQSVPSEPGVTYDLRCAFAGLSAAPHWRLGYLASELRDRGHEDYARSLWRACGRLNCANLAGEIEDELLNDRRVARSDGRN